MKDIDFIIFVFFWGGGGGGLIVETNCILEYKPPPPHPPPPPPTFRQDVVIRYKMGGCINGTLRYCVFLVPCRYEENRQLYCMYSCVYLLLMEKNINEVSRLCFHIVPAEKCRGSTFDKFLINIVCRYQTVPPLLHSISSFPGLPHFYLPFAFTIIHICSCVLMHVNANGRHKRGRAGNKAISLCFVVSLFSVS